MLTISANPQIKNMNMGTPRPNIFRAQSKSPHRSCCLKHYSFGCPRIIEPTPLENLNAGLLFSLGASLINLVVALILIENGKRNSIVLEADGKHLLTDVWTSAGVIAGF